MNTDSIDHRLSFRFFTSFIFSCTLFITDLHACTLHLDHENRLPGYYTACFSLSKSVLCKSRSLPKFCSFIIFPCSAGLSLSTKGCLFTLLIGLTIMLCWFRLMICTPLLATSYNLQCYFFVTFILTLTWTVSL